MKEKKFEKEYDIVGKGITPEQKKEASYYLEGRKDGAMEPIEGEYLKTPEELKVIKYINKYLDEEFKKLDIKEKINIKPEQIHLLPSDVYNKIFSIKDPRAIFGGLNQGAYIDKLAHTNRLDLYNAMLHESIHLVSFSRFYAQQEERREIKPSIYRTGYQVFSKRDKGHEHFRGLNEMITDAINVGILNKHKNELIKEFNITKEEQEQTIDRYPIEILETIIKRIAEKNNEEERDVWLRFKKGFFTGEMMRLREVEKTFGKGSLRMLASLYSGTKDEIKDSEAYGKILSYFETDNEKEKDRIADEILIEREKSEIKK